MSSDPPPTLATLADTITRSGLREPAVLALEVLGPIDVIATQTALFVRPLLSGTRWESYAKLLAEDGSWKELRSLLARQ